MAWLLLNIFCPELVRPSITRTLLALEENPYEVRVVAESELIPFIERGYEIVKGLGDGKYVRRPN